MNRTLILVNPSSRNGDLGREWSELKRQVLEALSEPTAQVAFTTETENGTELVRAALRSGAKRIVVVGGDGTLSAAVQGFFDGDRSISPDAVLFLLSAGRGNDFFRTITGDRRSSRKNSWNQGLELMRSGQPRAIDVGWVRWLGSTRLKERHFINITGFGLPGMIVNLVHHPKGTLNKGWIGKTHLTYAIHCALGLLKFSPVSVEVKVDGKEFYDGKIHAGFILNGRNSGGGICWDGEARLDDGKFNIMVMGPYDLITISKYFYKIMNDRWDGIDKVYRTQGKHVEVRLKPGQSRGYPLFEMDGDCTDDSEAAGATFDLLPGAIQVQMPLAIV